VVFEGSTFVSLMKTKCVVSVSNWLRTIWEPLAGCVLVVDDTVDADEDDAAEAVLDDEDALPVLAPPSDNTICGDCLKTKTLHTSLASL
jgi:hypothetical protein